MKLSVAMITYNHKRFIAQAIESVSAQRVNLESEIVVGEDCSTDGTRAIVMDYGSCPALPRPGQANSSGTKRRRPAEHRVDPGREGDDYWTCTDKLQKQVHFLDAHPDYAICCHRVRVLDELGKGWGNAVPQPLRVSLRHHGTEKGRARVLMNKAALHKSFRLFGFGIGSSVPEPRQQMATIGGELGPEISGNDWAQQPWLEKYGYTRIRTRAECINIGFREWGHQWLYDAEELDRRLREASFTQMAPAAWGQSNYPELRSRETRKETRLIMEATKYH